MSARFTFRSGARLGQVDILDKAYIELGRHPLCDVRCDAERDLDVSARHAAVVRQGGRYVLRDLGSRNGTFLNSRRITGDAPLQDGDVIGLGEHGPAVKFRGAGEERRSSTAVRIAAEVARQTGQLRRTTKLLIGLLLLVLAAFGTVEWKAARQARELARLEAQADSLGRAAQQLVARVQTELGSVRDALRQSQADVARLSRQLAAARASGDPGLITELRAELGAAAARQRDLAGAAAVDYRAISRQNQDAVALLVVEYSDTEIYSGTAFAVDSAGLLVTVKHVLVGEARERRPRRIAVKFSGSRQWFPGRFVGVADSADVGVVQVDVKGGTPRVAGFASADHPLERGDPVAIIGYPLGESLPMEHRGESGVIADPTLTVGTVSKVLSDLVQVDGYGAPGSSGSPIFDRDGRVAAVLYGGNRESQGRIIYAVPTSAVLKYVNGLR